MSNLRAVSGKASLDTGRVSTSGVKRWHPNHTVETLSKENQPTITPLRAKRQKLCGRTPPSKVRLGFIAIITVEYDNYSTCYLRKVKVIEKWT